jgi:hypothetical protein
MAAAPDPDAPAWRIRAAGLQARFQPNFQSNSPKIRLAIDCIKK